MGSPAGTAREPGHPMPGGPGSHRRPASAGRSTTGRGRSCVSASGTLAGIRPARRRCARNARRWPPLARPRGRQVPSADAAPRLAPAARLSWWRTARGGLRRWRPWNGRGTRAWRSPAGTGAREARVTSGLSVEAHASRTQCPATVRGAHGAPVLTPDRKADATRLERIASGATACPLAVRPPVARRMRRALDRYSPGRASPSAPPVTAGPRPAVEDLLDVFMTPERRLCYEPVQGAAARLRAPDTGGTG
jgi:hypothetical protein